MRITSVRLRLALWNVGLLALVLVAFGAAIRYTSQVAQTEALDRELAISATWLVGGEFGRRPPPHRFGPHNSGHRFERGDRRGPPHDFFPGPPGPGEGPPGVWGPGPWEHHGPPPAEWQPGAWAPGEGPPPPRRPSKHRFLDLAGRVLGPSGHSVSEPAAGPWDRDAFARAVRGREVYSIIQIRGEPVRVLSVPLSRGGKVEGVLQLAMPLIGLYEDLDRLSGTLLTLFPVALLVAALGGMYLTEHALRPVRQITQAAAQIGASDLGERLPVEGKDEFSELAGTFNGMLGRLEQAFAQLAQALEQQRRFTADASHELRTPLTIIKANTSLALEEERSNAQYRRALEAADRATDTTTRIVQDLLLLARGDAGQLRPDRSPLRIHELLESAAEVCRSSAAARIEVELSRPSLLVPGDPHHLLRLFTNLLQNAVRHTPPTGTITVTVSVEGDSGVVRVRDTGEGIPAEHLPHVCERFYRVDAARTRGHGGTGLGLAICQSIVEAHHGSLCIESIVGKGTTVTVRLPGPAVVTEDDPAPPGDEGPEGSWNAGQSASTIGSSAS